MTDKSKDRLISEVPLSCSNKKRHLILWCHSSRCGWSEVQSQQAITLEPIMRFLCGLRLKLCKIAYFMTLSTISNCMAITKTANSYSCTLTTKIKVWLQQSAPVYLVLVNIEYQLEPLSTFQCILASIRSSFSHTYLQRVLYYLKDTLISGWV